MGRLFSSLYELVQNVPRKNHQPVQTIASENPKPWTEEDERANQRYNQNQDWFYSHFGKLYSQYRGRSIAVYNQKVIASARHTDKLLQKIENYPDQSAILIFYFESVDRIHAFS